MSEQSEQMERKLRLVPLLFVSYNTERPFSSLRSQRPGEWSPDGRWSERTWRMISHETFSSLLITTCF
ncbi:hypothetical protein P879_05273 [Paragonimus westermani]|uniref:Uncharacterized protein n=1 Tax=Paragonimus westermani TaxID=34504 RepID=A0A8T0DV85_9TREM|nr:hypothetical protein P879_05273 [Paragonimus westermani]